MDNEKKVNLKLNKNTGAFVQPHGYELDATVEYVIDLEDEVEFQVSIIESIQAYGAPPAISDYHNWLIENGFDPNLPNPTNEFVSKFYGKKPLWKTNYSQGIVVKNCAENDDDYFIVVECSRENRGYKYTQIIVTLAGCV